MSDPTRDPDLTVVVDPTTGLGRASSPWKTATTRRCGGEISDPRVREIRGTVYTSRMGSETVRILNVVVRAVLLTAGFLLIIYGLGRLVGLLILDMLGFTTP